MPVLELIQQQSRKIANHIAIEAPDRKGMNYGELAEQVDATTQQLLTFGIVQTDRIAIVLPNGPEMAVTFLAVASVAASAPLNPHYLKPEYEFYLSDLKPKALIVTQNDDSVAVDVARELDIDIIRLIPGNIAGQFTLAPESQNKVAPPLRDIKRNRQDIALVLHTSGTTSRPKIVQLSQQNVLASAKNIATTLALSTSDRCLNVMPLFHIHGLMAAVMASIYSGASIVCTPGFQAPRFFSWMQSFKPSWYTAVPTMHQSILLRAKDNLDIIASCPLRFMRSSSASLAPSVLHELEATFKTVVIEAYGMTEAAHQMSSNPLPPGNRVSGSVGLAAGPDVAIMNEDGELVAPDCTGEIVIKGENVTPGYDNNPNANTSAFINGWFRTGDQGIMDKSGYLRITGRLKEIINRGGEKVSPREVDEILLSHPDVQQALAFAVPDSKLGEEVAAVVVLQANADITEAELRHFAAEKLTFFKVPKQILFLDKIPIGPTGKLQRIGLAEKLGIKEITTQARVDRTPATTEVQTNLFNIWLEILGFAADRGSPPFGIHSKFLDVGGDSVLATQVAVKINSDFDIDFPISTLFELPTIAELADAIETLLWMNKNKDDTSETQGEVTHI